MTSISTAAKTYNKFELVATLLVLWQRWALALWLSRFQSRFLLQTYSSPYSDPFAIMSQGDKTKLKLDIIALNQRLRKRKLCRVCKETELNNSGITFLPCGHFITCEACADKLTNCIACGRMIFGTVRTFLS